VGPLAALLPGHVGLGYAPSSRPAAAGPLDPRRLKPHSGYNCCSALENPEAILALAQRNLERYIGNRPAPATSLWRQWRALLEENSIDRIVAVMKANTQKATELRQASPFAGALTREEIAGTIQREKERARTRH
jgi:hypothetical protein